MFAILSTAWVVPGLLGPVLAERISGGVGWRWVFLAPAPARRRRRVAGPAGDDAHRPGRRARSHGADAFWRHRMVEAVRVAAGAALVVASFNASRWLLVPGIAGGLVVGLGPLARLTPPGTLRARAGLPSVILSRGLLTFAFFGTDTFVPYALHRGRGRRCSPAASPSRWRRWRGRWARGSRTTGSAAPARPVRPPRLRSARAGDRLVAVAALPDVLPFWCIHVGWALGGSGSGLGYSAHSQLDAALRAGATSTARRRRRCSCSTTSASPSAPAPSASSSRSATTSAGPPATPSPPASVSPPPSPARPGRQPPPPRRPSQCRRGRSGPRRPGRPGLSDRLSHFDRLAILLTVAKILLQTTIAVIPDDWNVGRFSLLADELRTRWPRGDGPQPRRSDRRLGAERASTRSTTTSSG